MKSKFVLFLLIATLFFNGCVTPQNISPAYERVQTSASTSQVKSAIIEVYTSNGWNMERETDHMITFVIENKNPIAQFFYSSQYDSRVMMRESVTIMDSQDGVTLSANQVHVTNYGSAFERSESVDSPKSDERLIQVCNLLKSKN